MPGKQDWLATGLPAEGQLAAIPDAGQAADPEVPTATLDERVAEVRDRVREARYDTCVAVNEHRVVLGLLRSEQLEGDGEQTIEDAMRPGPSTFRPHVGVSELAKLMEEHGLPDVPITTGEGVLVGLLTLERAKQALKEIHGEHEH